MNNQVKVVAIDHGNRFIKTLNHVFPASFVESGHLPSFGVDTLMYKSKEYTITDRRMPQKNDKTTDEAYFILTLFAIGKELTADMDTPMGEAVDVDLLVGLPPLHCKEMGAKFANYFKEQGGLVRFEFDKIPFVIRVKDVYVYPQAYAAAMTVRKSVKDSVVVNIVDVGGYTVDCLQLVDFQPNHSMCTSLYHGVNTLFQRINEPIRAKGAKDIPDVIIKGILQNNEKILRDCASERVALVHSVANQFAVDILLGVSQVGLDLIESTTVFIGGGSLLLRGYIEKSGMVAKPIFVESVNANAEGYQLLYVNRNAIRVKEASA